MKNLKALRPFLAVSRRSDDEIHPWVPNGDLRPFPDIGEAGGGIAMLAISQVLNIGYG
jgi:hypothetical protein